jgi:hypothetical protein
MNVKRTLTYIVLQGLLVGLLPLSVQALTISLPAAADTSLRRDVNTTSNFGAANIMYLRENGSSRDFKGYMRFDLSGLGPITINSATLTLYSLDADSATNDPRSDSIVDGRFQLHGVNEVAGNTPQNWDELTITYANAGADRDLTNVTALDTETITGTVPNQTITVTGTGILSFLQGRVDSATNSGLTTFILDFPGPTSDRGYQLATKENANAALHPVLTLDYTIPEPASFALLGLAIIGTGLCRRG